MRPWIEIVCSVVFILSLVSCSTKFVPTTDVCSIHRHEKDPLYQVQINGRPINQFWYLKEDSVELTKLLAKDNKCMK